jgi:uncharacterized membrane protein (Fun14 family)
MKADALHLNNQAGQAVVFVMAMLGVILVSVVFLYQAGRITTEKMQLQNAADAAAFTTSTLEARALNFTAYTNRAMVANEIAIGQGVGLLSFASELKSVKKFFYAYANLIDLASVGTAEEFTGPMRAIGAGIGTAGKAMEETLDKIVPYWIKAFHTVNKIYSITQNIYHYTTAALVMDGVGKSLQGNVVGTRYGGNLFKNLLDPPKENAKASPISLVAMVGHFSTYLNGYTRRFNQADATYDSNHLDQDGMGRFAATVRRARDDFSSGQGPNTRNWKISGHGGIDYEIITLKMKLEAASKGGTELIKKNNRFIWAGGDTGGFKAKIKLLVGPPPPLPPIKLSISVSSPSIPFGAGGYQAADNSQSLSSGDLAGATRPSQPSGLGGATEQAWWFAKNKIRKNKVALAPYGGLPAYRDVAVPSEPLEKFPFAFPFFLIAVEKDHDRFKAMGPQFKKELDLGSGKSFDKKIAAVAKSEVYFSRPSDLDYFARKDGNREKENLFSPFWQARLVDTSDLDRFFVLALQQKTIWASKADLQRLPTELTQSIVRGLESFLRMFP